MVPRGFERGSAAGRRRRGWGRGFLCSVRLASSGPEGIWQRTERVSRGAARHGWGADGWQDVAQRRERSSPSWDGQFGGRGGVIALREQAVVARLVMMDEGNRV